MAELIHELLIRLSERRGNAVRPPGLGRAQDRRHLGGLAGVRSSHSRRCRWPCPAHRETTQPNRDAVASWAGGLEPIYFEGAFARAS